MLKKQLCFIHATFIELTADSTTPVNKAKQAIKTCMSGNRGLMRITPTAAMVMLLEQLLLHLVEISAALMAAYKLKIPGHKDSPIKKRNLYRNIRNDR